MWCLNNNVPALIPDRARWSQRFCPSSGRVDAPIGGFRGTAASLPTALSSVSSIQVGSYILPSEFDCVSASCCVSQHSTFQLCCLFSCQQQKKKTARPESVCLHRRERRTQEGRGGYVGVREKLMWQIKGESFKRRILFSCESLCQTKAIDQSVHTEILKVTAKRQQNWPAICLFAYLFRPVSVWSCDFFQI